MKVYWSDREGKPAPPNAHFQCRSFFPDAPTPFTAVSERIDQLPEPTCAIVRQRRYLPDRSQWFAAVERALSRKMEKIVLARCQVLTLEKKPDPFALTAALKKKAQGAYVFCFSEGDTAFLGATPERLFFRKENTLYSEAVAGTRPRGKTENEDAANSRELLSSAKDLRELSPVQTFLQTSLSPLCESPLSFSPIAIHKTQNVQHLYSQCKGTLKKGVLDGEILKQIHPTPALCGTPTDAAFDLIRELEPFERGLYGGALGWQTPESSEWIVGIRCCLIRRQTAYLYTGTGIVEGSDPAEEWEELDQKGKLYDGIFL